MGVKKSTSGDSVKGLQQKAGASDLRAHVDDHLATTYMHRTSVTAAVIVKVWGPLIVTMDKASHISMVPAVATTELQNWPVLGHCQSRILGVYVCVEDHEEQ